MPRGFRLGLMSEYIQQAFNVVYVFAVSMDCRRNAGRIRRLHLIGIKKIGCLLDRHKNNVHIVRMRVRLGQRRRLPTDVLASSNRPSIKLPQLTCDASLFKILQQSLIDTAIARNT